MKNKVIESTVILIGLLKWFVLAAVIGVLIGAGVSYFLIGLAKSIKFVTHLSYYYFLLLPVGFFVSAVMIKYFAPEAEGHGTEKVITAVHKRNGKINPLIIPVKTAATIITVAVGGSVGKEGPAAQVGGGIASLFSDIFKLDDRDRKIIVISGISAGFSAVFGTPIAGSIFGVEVLYIGTILYWALFPSFIAGTVSFLIARHIGLVYFYKQLNLIPQLNHLLFGEVILSGLFFGFVALLFIETINSGKYISLKLRISKPLKALIGGSVLILFTFLFSQKYLGLGIGQIEKLIKGSSGGNWDFLLKMVFTSITLNFGGSGGIVTPIFFVGASAGNLFGRVVGSNVSMFSALGIIGVLAGAANTPIAASIMAIELFGSEIAPYAAIVAVVSFLMSGHRSIYPSQILAISKSPFLTMTRWDEIEKINKIYVRKEIKIMIRRGKKL